MNEYVRMSRLVQNGMVTANTRAVRRSAGRVASHIAIGIARTRQTTLVMIAYQNELAMICR
ncbi:unannotated protein [freshwater metagenome]|uniref:Unannotated protein n=1 Tax=freshwater metagenome TaxID=449393 RepID=A0A6J7J1F6_9ZZZZ